MSRLGRRAPAYWRSSGLLHAQVACPGKVHTSIYSFSLSTPWMTVSVKTLEGLGVSRRAEKRRIRQRKTPHSSFDGLASRADGASTL